MKIPAPPLLGVRVNKSCKITKTADEYDAQIMGNHNSKVVVLKISRRTPPPTHKPPRWLTYSTLNLVSLPHFMPHSAVPVDSCFHVLYMHMQQQWDRNTTTRQWHSDFESYNGIPRLIYELCDLIWQQFITVCGTNNNWSWRQAYLHENTSSHVKHVSRQIQTKIEEDACSGVGSHLQLTPVLLWQGNWFNSASCLPAVVSYHSPWKVWIFHLITYSNTHWNGE